MFIGIRLFITCLFLVISLILKAQSDALWFRDITFETGLPFNKTCFTMGQDQKGFIWIGSDIGLHRYDGNDFRSYVHDWDDINSIREGKVNAVFFDSKNNFWVATSSGVDLFLEDENRFVHVPMIYEPIGLANEPVIGFYENSKNELFLHCHFSIYRYNPELAQFDRIITNIKDIDQTETVFESIIEYNGYFLIGTNLRGVGLFNIEKKEIRWFGSKFIGVQKVNQLYKTGNNQVWIATDNGVSLITSIDDLINNQEDCFKIIENTTGVVINFIAEDKQGYIWASSDGRGIFRIDPISHEVLNYQHDGDIGSILNNKTALVYVDSHNNLWAFFSNYGFNVSNLDYDGFFRTYTSNSKKNNRLSGDIVTSFAEDQKGNIWIGTDGDGLNYFDVANQRFEHFFSDPSDPNSLSSNVIISLYIDSDQKLWIGTYQGGLNCFDPVTGRFKSFKHDETDSRSISGNEVTSILEDDDGNLVVLTNTNGLNIMDKKTGSFRHINREVNDNKKLSHNGGTSLFKDHKGNIWIGTYYGLNRMDAKTKDVFKYFHDPNDHTSISSFSIDYIFEDSRKRIWVGTNNGLNLLEEQSGKFRRFTTKNGLPDNQINSIIEDEYGFLWIGTNKGLSKINLHTFEMKNYGENYNLPGHVLVPRSVLKSTDGNLYFGGNRGFTSFDPLQKNFILDLPPIYFTDFRIFDQSVQPHESFNNRVILQNDISSTSSITLDNIHKSFSITFSSLDYAKIVKPEYYYILEGFDDQWRKIESQTRTLNYTNLDAGTYELKIKMTTTEGVNSDVVIGLELTILPPWWKTWWAYLLYVAVFWGVLLSIILVTLNRFKLSQNLMIEKNQKEREIEIGRIKDNFYTNITHEFRTPLTLVLGPLESIVEKYQHDSYLSNQIQLIRRNTTRLLFLINELLDFKKIEAGAMKLKVREDNFSNFFAQIAQNFTSFSEIQKIHFVVDIVDKDVILWYDRKKMEKVFYNLLSNAFKYTPENGNIYCRLKLQSNNTVSVTIQDSGIGIPENEIDNVFKKYYSALNAMGYESTGLGLYLTKEIVELHKGSIVVKNNINAGACFEVQLKLGNNHFDPSFIADNTRLETASDVVANPEMDITQAENDEIKIPGNNENTYEKPIILIVEDNPDVRFFIKSELIGNYSILEAVNGAQGLKVAREKIPDLIISDIMMPEMDGRSLCNTLKNDVRTSHIPIIMLTALSDIESRISGLEMGADSYISKPFHPKHLNVRVKKLLNLRQALQTKYSNQIDQVQPTFEYTPGEVEKMSGDELFMGRLIKIIEDNLSDSNFQLDDLCTIIGMNYLQLYRKVKAITNMSIKQFILTIKMRNAAKMLESGKFNISEVAYDVGFSSPAYFSETFKKHFSQTPSEFIQQKG
jgi:signal transduction histidine kinase/ligand-binding sensor domain-containing protein/AraC-like DNA-binding protein/AmiR/NasT family two-component response regulator